MQVLILCLVLVRARESPLRCPLIRAISRTISRLLLKRVILLISIIAVLILANSLQSQLPQTTHQELIVLFINQ